MAWWQGRWWWPRSRPEARVEHGGDDEAVGRRDRAGQIMSSG